MTHSNGRDGRKKDGDHRRIPRRPRYGQWAAITRWIAAALVALVAMGCAGFGEQARSGPDGDDAQEQEAMETAQDLYEALVTVFEEETPGVDEERPQALAVVSHYEGVGSGERRRFVGQVVPLRGGIGVQIRAEYQSEALDDEGNATWEDQPREAVRPQAVELESRLVRAVERQYHRQSG